jgi:ferredoxin
VRVPCGTRLVEAVRRAGLPIASACGAAGLCARCDVRILSGEASVSSETPEETRAKRANRIDPEHRLSCMAAVFGDVKVTASYW